MKQTEIKRKTPMRRTEFKPAEPKPPAGPRKRKCAICREPFIPRSMTHKACKPECAEEVANRVAAKQRAKQEKAERQEIRRRKELDMPIKKRLKATEKLVNRYVVLRDRSDGCISCHMPSHYDGIWHASHFKSVGSNSALRFNLWNIHKSCEQCNLFKSGNIAEYEKRLLLKIGSERLDWLKCHDRVRKYDAEWLIRLSNIMRRKIKRLEKKYA
jgi:hypothetical protein